jgi:hypothetical protein
MENVRVPAAPGLELAQIATLSGIWSEMSTVLAEIVASTLAQPVLVQGRSRAKSFLAGSGAARLVFVASAEADRPDLIPVRLHGTTTTQTALRGICYRRLAALCSFVLCCWLQSRKASGEK